MIVSNTSLVLQMFLRQLCSFPVRSAISIVPQSPDLFEGTMRENIDPTGEYQDAEIWMSLSQVITGEEDLCKLQADQGINAGPFEGVRGEFT